MSDSISVVIPAHNEEASINRCLRSVRTAAAWIGAPVEIVVVLNRCTDATGQIAEQYGASLVSEDARNLARIRNTGVKASSGDIIVTIDADSYMSRTMLQEVTRRLARGKYVGGGVRIVPERMSVGILFSFMMFVPKLILEQRWVGMFWLTREVFDAVGGFNERLLTAEDVDLAKRLKAFGVTKDLRYGVITRAHIVTSCRKFDQFGDWFLFRNPRLVARVLSGHDEEAANRYWYEVPRTKGRSAEPGDADGRSLRNRR